MSYTLLISNYILLMFLRLIQLFFYFLIFLMKKDFFIIHIELST